MQEFSQPCSTVFKLMGKAMAGNDSGDTNSWERARTISAIASATLLPLVLAWVGHIYAESQKQRDVSLKYVELALRILESPANGPASAPLRTWAVDVLNDSGPTKLPAEAMAQLRIAPILTVRITHARYEEFLEEMQAVIDAPSMEAAVDVGRRFNHGFAMMKAVLPTPEAKTRAQAGYDIIYCQLHRKFVGTDSERMKVVTSCNARNVPRDVNPAKREIAELFGALPFYQ
jgi:hypothetical protein